MKTVCDNKITHTAMFRLFHRVRFHPRLGASSIIVVGLIHPEEVIHVHRYQYHVA
jgi:hypothetical protein